MTTPENQPDNFSVTSKSVPSSEKAKLTKAKTATESSPKPSQNDPTLFKTDKNQYIDIREMDKEELEKWSVRAQSLYDHNSDKHIQYCEECESLLDKLEKLQETRNKTEIEITETLAKYSIAYKEFQRYGKNAKLFSDKLKIFVTTMNEKNLTIPVERPGSMSETLMNFILRSLEKNREQ